MPILDVHTNAVFAHDSLRSNVARFVKSDSLPDIGNGMLVTRFYQGLASGTSCGNSHIHDSPDFRQSSLHTCKAAPQLCQAGRAAETSGTRVRACRGISQVSSSLMPYLIHPLPLVAFEIARKVKGAALKAAFHGRLERANWGVVSEASGYMVW